MFPFSVTKWFNCCKSQSEIMAGPVQCVPRTVRLSHDDIINGLGVQRLCNPSLLCHFNCALVYVPLSWYSLLSGVGLKLSYSCLSWGWELHYCVWSSWNTCVQRGKVEIKEAGWLGYRWKHFLSRSSHLFISPATNCFCLHLQHLIAMSLPGSKEASVHLTAVSW